MIIFLQFSKSDKISIDSESCVIYSSSWYEGPNRWLRVEKFIELLSENFCLLKRCGRPVVRFWDFQWDVNSDGNSKWGEVWRTHNFYRLLYSQRKFCFVPAKKMNKSVSNSTYESILGASKCVTAALLSKSRKTLHRPVRFSGFRSVLILCFLQLTFVNCIIRYTVDYRCITCCSTTPNN